jgi:hypothetical protein
MIETPTTFILGAGAHCSYGFPSGEKLKAEIVTTINTSINSDDNDLIRLAMNGHAKKEHVSNQRCKAFVQAIANAGQPSIDAFLNANRHQVGFEIIGKAGIAQALLKYESTTDNTSTDDWLTYLFQLMLDGVSSPHEFIERNKVGFITFNYDRFLEGWLHNRIVHSFGICEADALDVLHSIPIHHVYGMLGKFPANKSTNPQVWIDATTGIRTIFDSEKDPSILSAAKTLLDKAQAICLLGFGFHGENIEILDLPIHINRCSGNVFASRFGLTDAEFSRLTKAFQTTAIRKPFEGEMCLQTLRKAHIF